MATVPLPTVAEPDKDHIYIAIVLVIVLFLVGTAMELKLGAPVATAAIMNCTQVLFVAVVAAFGFKTALQMLRKYGRP